MIPEGWIHGRVGDLLIGLESGVSVNGEDRAFDHNDKAVLKVSAVSYGKFNPFAAKIINTDEIERAKTNPRAGQVIVSRSNTEELVGASAFIDSDYPNLFLPDKLWQTIPKPASNMKWLSYVLASAHVRYKLSKLATGTSGSMKNITQGELLSLKIAIPPLPEQKKIAQILSTWDNAITTTEQLLANSQQQKKALMQQLLTGKRRLKGFSGKWQTAKLGHLTEKVGSGITPTGGSTVYASSGIPFIRSQNVLWGELDFSDVAYINDSQHKKMSGSSVLPNDVLLNITGASIGRCCTVPEKLKTSNVNQHVCIIRPKKNLSSDYLKSFLLSHYGQKQIEQFQAGGNRQGLNFEQIKSFKIHIPEFEEQQKIAAVLSAADCEIEILQQKLEGLKQEKKALMQQLLTGRRRVQA